MLESANDNIKASHSRIRPDLTGVVNARQGAFEDMATPHTIKATKTLVSQRLQYLNPPTSEDITEHEAYAKKHHANGTQAPSLMGNLTFVENEKFSFSIQADYQGLEITYRFHKKEMEKAPFEAEMVRLLGDDKLLWEKFEVAAEFDSALNKIIWSTVDEYIAPQSDAKNKPSNAKSFQDMMDSITVVINGYKADGIGEHEARNKIRTMQDAIRKIASEEFELKPLKPATSRD